MVCDLRITLFGIFQKSKSAEVFVFMQVCFFLVKVASDFNCFHGIRHILSDKSAYIFVCVKWRETQQWRGNTDMWCLGCWMVSFGILWSNWIEVYLFLLITYSGFSMTLASECSSDALSYELIFSENELHLHQSQTL